MGLNPLLEAGLSADVNPVTQTITLTSDGSLLGFYFAQSTQQWATKSLPVSFECEFVSSSGSVDITLLVTQPNEADPAIGEQIAGAYMTSSAGGQLQDPVGGAPIGSITVEDGYRFGFNIDPVARTVQIYDSQGNDSTLPLPENYDSAAPLKLLLTSGTSQNDNIIFRPNFGSRGFELPQSGVGYCAAESGPDGYCPPASVAIQQRVPPNDQIMVLTGPDLLTLETESLGNTDIQSFAFPNVGSILTQPTKFEAILRKNTVTDPAGGWGMFFLDEATRTQLIAGVFIGATSTTIFDPVGGAPLATSQSFPLGYQGSMALSPGGVAVFRDSNDNVLAPAVDPGFNPAAAVVMILFVSAGSNVGQEMDFDMNFGSRQFQKGNIEKRRCA
jgi:hypothetical protein